MVRTEKTKNWQRRPDITGQRFGRLVILKKSEIRNGRRMWEARCDCGNVIERERSVFDYGRQVSCGCLDYANGKRKRQPKNITGQRFGQLTAVRLSGRRIYDRPAWLLQCDCGGSIEMPLKYLTVGNRLHCGAEHHLWGNKYPETPNPLPDEASKLIVKYFHLLTLPSNQIKSEVEDEQRDRLIRASWIIAYRRSQGEVITELHEKRLIQKYIRMAAIAVKQRNYIDQNGGYVVRSDGKILKAKIKSQRLIGGEMTDATFLDYPVSESETPEINILSNQPKRFCFKRR